MVKVLLITFLDKKQNIIFEYKVHENLKIDNLDNKVKEALAKTAEELLKKIGLFTLNKKPILKETDRLDESSEELKEDSSSGVSELSGSEEEEEDELKDSYNREQHVRNIQTEKN